MRDFAFLLLWLSLLALVAPMSARANVFTTTSAVVASMPKLADARTSNGTGAPTKSEAFDALLEDLGSHGDHEEVDDAAHLRNRARLVALLPAGDAARAERLEAFDCYQFTLPPDKMLAQAEAGLARSHASSRLVRMEYLMCKAQAQYSLGQVYTATLTELLSLADPRAFPRLRAAALLLRSFQEGDTGHYASALATQREVLALDIARGADRSARITNTLIADTLSDMGLFESATAILQPIITSARKSRNTQLLSIALEKLGIVQARLGETDAALASLRESARIEEGLGGGDSLASAWLRIAQLQADQGQLQEARELDAKAQAEMVKSGAEELLAARHAYLQATIAFAAGDTAGALAHLQDALARWRAEETLRSLADGLSLKARIYRSLGQWREALDAREEDMRIRQNLDSRMQREQASFLAAELENSRRNLDNQRLQQRADLQSRELRSSQREQRLRMIVILLLVLLLALLAASLMLTRKRLVGARTDAMTDSLTGIASRRHMLMTLNQALQYQQRSGSALSVLAIDIDHFKRINDEHGHGAGDQVLRRVSNACRHALRQSDPFGRMGGEEFLALLPGVDVAAAIPLAQRMRDMVADLAFDDIAPFLRATVSIGIAEADTSQVSAEDLLARADLALYQAKHNGRNRVEVAHASARQAQPN